MRVRVLKRAHAYMLVEIAEGKDPYEHAAIIGKMDFSWLQQNLPGNAAAKGSFKTPPSGAGHYNFVVYGDTRTRNDVHRGVMAELLKHDVPDFVLHTGDMVADGNDTSLWPIFFDIEKDLLRQTAFFPSLGNHERNTHYFGDLFQADAPYYSLLSHVHACPRKMWGLGGRNRISAL